MTDSPATLIPCDGDRCDTLFSQKPRWLSPNSFLCNLPECTEGSSSASEAPAVPEMDCQDCEKAALDHLYSKSCAVSCCDAVTPVPDCDLCAESHDEWKDLSVFDFASMEGQAFPFGQKNDSWNAFDSLSSSVQPSTSSSTRDSSPNGPHPAVPQASTSTAIASPYICRWANCLCGFNTPGELANHVHLAHLISPEATSPFPQANTSQSSTLMYQSPNPTASWSQAQSQQQPCLWDGCGTLLPFVPDQQQMNTLPQPQVDLMQHLQTNHLIPTTSSTQMYDMSNAPQFQFSSMPQDYSINTNINTNTNQYSAPPTASSSKTSMNDFNLPGIHQCHWEGCSEILPTAADLTAHIGDVHVGSGKSEYYCNWVGCARAEEGRKFTQRQKVMRHVQMHTGDRPFVCPDCQKSFSEQTTLAQHMRTHTNERPHVCQEDGCGKAFTLASALTIHTRTHTGDKPFKCPHAGCSAAFAESSNLRKHIRTHTGERKFTCTVADCTAKFGRSDQLARHAKMHERKGEL